MEIYLVGIGLVVLVAQLGLIALVLWIGYRLVVSAVRTAILEADDIRAQRASIAAPPSAYSSDSSR